MAQQVKSKERVAERGEVFTSEREVKAMCDLVRQETERIDSRFLEPACGDGNFLAEILTRKLAVVKKKYSRSAFDYERNAVLAASSIYGVDIMLDNVEACRNRMFKIWNKEYESVCKSNCNNKTREAVKFIFSRNIICGNALSLMCVDKNCLDTDDYIIFSEWSFVTSNLIKRRDFRLDVLMREDDGLNSHMQLSLFGEDTEGADNWEIDPETNAFIPAPIKEYDLIDYRRIQENG